MYKSLLFSILASLSFLSVSGEQRFPNLDVWQASQATTFAPAAELPIMTSATSAADGKTIYCGVNIDLLRRRGGFASYNTSDPMNSLEILDPNALNWIDDADYDAVRSGAYVKGKYYAFIYKDYTFVHQMKSFGTFDIETGTYTRISGPQGTPTFYELGYDSDFEYFSPVYSMAYDNTNDVLYCLYYDIANYMGSIANCCLGTVDYNTGKISFVASLQNFYYNLAVDYFGNIYAMTYKLEDPEDVDSGIVGTWLNKLTVNADHSVTESNLVEVTNQMGDPYISTFIQDMDYDHDDWIIRWNQVQSTGATYICELDPETGVYHNTQLIGSNAVVVGLHAPYTSADSPEAPGHVSNLTAISAAEGKGEVTLTWTNPTTSWNRKPLAAVTQVNIYRGEELIAIVSEGVSVGSDCSYTDTEAPLGFVNYKVVACRNEDEEGQPTTIQSFVGYDAPGAVQNLTLTTTDTETATLNWDAPAIGLNGGWYDPSTVTYTITRLPDYKVVATDIAENTFTDTSLNTTQSYSYQVKSKNAAGEGLTATSNSLTLGPAISAPYSIVFTDANAAQTWVAYDANGDGDTWRYEPHPWYAWISTQYGNKGKDWLFSPNIRLQANHSYRVRFALHITNHTNTPDEYITFACGQGQTPEAMTITMAEKEHITNQEERYYSYTVTVDADGAYNFGLLAEGASGNYGTYFTAFSINSIATQDLAATQLSGPREISATASNGYTVTVTNKGAQTAAGYTVQLVDDDDNVLTETTECPSLEPQQEAEIKLRWAPAASLANSDLLIYGRVIYDGDGDASNDNTDGITVHIGEVSSAVWEEITPMQGWELVASQTMPLNFMYKACWSEVIYNQQLLGFAAGKYEISKISYEYEFGTTVEAAFDTYVGTTDQEKFSNPAEDIIGRAELTKAASVNQDIMKGKGTLTISFNKPVEWNGQDNIVIALDRRYNSYNDGDVFNNYFLAYESTDYTTYMAMQFGNDSGSFDWTATERTYVITQVPVTHFYITDLNSQAIREVVVGAFGYSIAGGQLQIAGGQEVRSAELYNLGGALVAKAQTLGNSACIDIRSLRAGTYLLVVNGQSMKVRF